MSDDDMVSYARTVADKVGESDRVTHQIRNYSSDKSFLGDFPQTVDDAFMVSSDAHQNQMMQILSNPQVAQSFVRVVFDMLLSKNDNQCISKSYDVNMTINVTKKLSKKTQESRLCCT